MCHALWLLGFAAMPATAGDVKLEVGGGLPRHDGFLQTPAGGTPGTSSAERPTFAETALRDGTYRWLAAAFDLERFRFHARYEAIRTDGEAQLGQMLTSQGQFFNAGQRIRSKASFDGLSLALTWTFASSRGWHSEVGGELAWTAFDLRIQGNESSVDRAYHVHTVGILGALYKQLGTRWRFGAVLGAAPRFDGAGSRYRLAPHIDLRLGERWNVALGVRFEQFRYDDAHKQALPNRLLVRRRVLPTLSMSARF